MVCKANTRVYTGSGKNALRPVDSTTARDSLHLSAHSRGYKLSREGTDPRSLQGGVCVVLERYVSVVPRCGPLPPLL
jgi:hypothetical protein